MPARFLTHHGRALGVRSPGAGTATGRSGGISLRDPRSGELLLRAEDLIPDEFTTGPVAVAANGSTMSNVRFDNTRAFVATDLRAVTDGAASALTLELTDQRYGRPWQSRACALELVTGTGQEPYVLPAPQLLLPDEQGTGSIMSARLSNTTGAALTGEVMFSGFSLPLKALSPLAIHALTRELVFFYSASLAIAAGNGTGTGQVVFVLHDDAENEIHDLQSDDRTLWDLRITDQGSRRQFSNANVRAELVMGTGSLPGSLPTPLRCGRGAVLVLDAVNRQAGAQTIEIVLAGTKVFPW